MRGDNTKITLAAAAPCWRRRWRQQLEATTWELNLTVTLTLTLNPYISSNLMMLVRMKRYKLELRALGV